MMTIKIEEAEMENKGIKAPERMMTDLMLSPLIVFDKVTPSCIIGGDAPADLKYIQQHYGKPLRLKSLNYNGAGRLVSVVTQSRGRCVTVRLDKCGASYTLSFSQHDPRERAPMGRFTQ